MQSAKFSLKLLLVIILFFKSIKTSLQLGFYFIQSIELSFNSDFKTKDGEIKAFATIIA